MSKNEIIETGTTPTNNLIKANIREIAKLCKRDVDISSALSEHTIDNMKAFLVAYSRSQLTRVIKLTDALGKLEDALIEQSLEPQHMDPFVLMNVIKVIQSSLNQAMNMIQKVTSDESFINIIIDNSKTINNTLNQYNDNRSNTPVLLNQDSRDKVRNLANQILGKLSEEEKRNNVVIDSKSGEVKGSNSLDD